MVPEIVPVPNGATCFAFSPAGERLIIGGAVRALRVYDWRAKRFDPAIAAAEPFENAQRLCFSNDGSTLVVTIFSSISGRGQSRTIVCDWPARAVRFATSGHRKQVAGLDAAWLPDNRRFATKAEDGTAKIWDAATGKKLKSLKASKEGVMSLAVSPDGRLLALGCEFGYLDVFDLADYCERYRVRVGSGDIHDITFSPDGQTLFVPSAKWLRAFDSDSGVEQFKLPSNCWWRAAVSLDGSLAACSHTDSAKLPWQMSVDIYDLRQCRRVASLPSRETPIFAFSPDGTHFVVSERYSCPFAYSPDGSALAVANDNFELWTIDRLLERGFDPADKPGRQNEAVVSTDPRTGAQRAADELAAKKSRPKSNVKGMPLPAHLAPRVHRIASKSGETHCNGEVRCPCGDTAVLLFTTDAFHEAKGYRRPITLLLGDEHVLAVEAQCATCAKRHPLFDSRCHGWNGYVVSGERVVEASPLVPWRCPACRGARHTVAIGITGEPKRTAIEESGEVLDHSNWQEGFGAIQLSITCRDCEWSDPTWVDFETM